MTLIFSAKSPYGMIFCGDILVSREKFEGSALAFPLIASPEDDSKVFSSKTFGITGFRQKVFLHDDQNAFLWCGSLLIARAIVSQAISKLNALHPINLFACAAEIGLTEQQLSDVGIIYLRRTAHGLEIRSLGCSHEIIDDVEVNSGGTGAWYAFHSGATSASIEAPMDGAAGFTNWTFSKIAKMLQDEVLFDEPLNFAFGGWFDTFTIDYSVFRRISYAIRFWGYKDGRVNSRMPLAFSNYSASNDLIVTTIDPRLPPERGARSVNVPSLFENREAMPSDIELYNPLIQLHMFIDLDAGATFFCFQNGRSDAILLDVSPREVVLDASPRWIEWVKASFEARAARVPMGIYDGINPR